MPLTLNGKPFDPHPPSRTTLKLTAFLDKSKADELFTTNELSQRSGVPISTIRSNCRPGAAYRQQVANKMLYGNPKAIAELRRELKA